MHAYIRRCLMASAVVTVLAAPGPSSAQTPPDPSVTQGFTLGLRTGGTGLAFEGGRDGTGEGFGIRVGYGFNERVTAFVGIDGTSVSDGDGFEGLPEGEEYGAVVMELGARVHFRTRARWLPFAEAAVSVIGLGFDDADGREVGYGGLGGSLGGGLLFFATPTVALEAGAAFTAGELWDREVGGIEDDVDIGASAVRIHVGVSFYPFR